MYTHVFLTSRFFLIARKCYINFQNAFLLFRNPAKTRKVAVTSFESNDDIMPYV